MPQVKMSHGQNVTGKIVARKKSYGQNVARLNVANIMLQDKMLHAFQKF